MKLSIFVAALSWASFFALMWLCLLQSDWQLPRIFSMIGFLTIALFSGSFGYVPKSKNA